MSIKISFMHYMKWTRIMLPDVSEEFELVCILLLFFFPLSLSISKRSTLAKNLGGNCSPPAPPVSTSLNDFSSAGLIVVKLVPTCTALFKTNLGQKPNNYWLQNSKIMRGVFEMNPWILNADAIILTVNKNLTLNNFKNFGVSEKNVLSQSEII